MSVCDLEDLRIIARLAILRAAWTPEKEAALQQHFVAIGIQTQAEADVKRARRAARIEEERR